MKNLLLPVIGKKFIDAVGKTAIECDNNGQITTVWANGDKSMDTSLLCNITVNEPGDTFVATKDSKQLDSAGKPIYNAGDTVQRNKQTYEFKSFAGNNAAAQFAQSASAFKLNLQVVMQ
jgi:hypothetical protein